MSTGALDGGRGRDTYAALFCALRLLCAGVRLSFSSLLLRACCGWPSSRSAPSPESTLPTAMGVYTPSSVAPKYAWAMAARCCCVQRLLSTASTHRRASRLQSHTRSPSALSAPASVARRSTHRPRRLHLRQQPVRPCLHVGIGRRQGFPSCRGVTPSQREFASNLINQLSRAALCSIQHREAVRLLVQ